MSKNQMSLEVEIIRGMHDANLNSLSAAIRARRDSLKQEKKLSFRVGQRVRFNDRTKPKYVIGSIGTIVKINRTRVSVDLDVPCRRFHKDISVPVSLIDPA